RAATYVACEGNMATSVIKTFCRTCNAHCGMEFEVEDAARITRIAADKDHPLTKGYFCIKGYAAVDLYDPGSNQGRNRLRTAQVRSPGGVLTDVATPRALNVTSARLKRVIDMYGPQSV